MGKIKHVLLASLLLGTSTVMAQTTPQHEQYVKGSSETIPFYTAYRNWQIGTPLYNGDEEAAENEEFYISRVKPKERFNFASSQVNKALTPDRKFIWWCPIGTTANGNWNATPSYFFDSEVFSMWSYLDQYGNWTAPFIRMPGAFADICHKNGVRTSVLASVPWAVTLNANDGEHGSNMAAMIDGGGEKLISFLRHYGIDGIGYNSEFSFGAGLSSDAFCKMVNDAFKQGEKTWPTFGNVWYELASNLSSGGGYFQNGENKVSDTYFLNYNWGDEYLRSSQQNATNLGRSTWDVYGGMDFQGRSSADWLSLQNYNISVGMWGAHDMNMIFENRMELGSAPEKRQQTYQLCSEHVFTGASCNPVNTPAVSNYLAHSAIDKKFHGVSKFITARSTLQTTNLADEPFVSYFNMGNGNFFNIEGQRTFDGQWYNIGIQDYLPTWRWWWTTNFMGRDAADVPADGLSAEFTWDDAWFGGSCLSVYGQTAQEYLQLFKTKYPLQNNDVLSIRYKVISGSGTMAWACMSEDEESEVSANIGTISAGEQWQVKEVKISSRRGELNLAEKTLAMMGLKFTNTSSDFKVYIGEISLTRSEAVTPDAPTIRNAETLNRTYKGIDFKVIFKMKDPDANFDPVYNEDVNAWYYKIYMQEEGSDKQIMCTATTSWASYVVGAPYSDVSGAKKIRIGVSAVSLDGKTESTIAWSDYLAASPNATIIEGYSVDKSVIKANEDFTVGFDDPNHAVATKWEIVKAATNEVVESFENVANFTYRLPEEGIYDLNVTYNGTTDTNRGMIQISPIEVGALPQVQSLKANDSETSITTDKKDPVTLTYTGREADGYVSRGILLAENAFGINAAQLNFNTQSKFTLSFWFYPRKYNHGSAGTRLIQVRNPKDQWPASDWGYIWSMIQPTEDGKQIYNFNLRKKYDNSGWQFLVNDFSFDPAHWYHMALVMDWVSGGRIFKFYINGREIYSSENAPTTDIYAWSDDDVLMIGGVASGCAGLDAYLDEVQLWNKPLTTEEVQSCMKHQVTIPDGLIGYWDFESDQNADDHLFTSTGTDKNLKASLVGTINNGEGKNEFPPIESGYAPGAPFISGSIYKIETLPSWNLGNKATVATSEGTDQKGTATANYSEAGKYTATLTLTNGWGSDSKTFEYIEVTDIPDAIGKNENDEYAVYPNPFVNEVNVKLVNAGTYTVEVYDIAGQALSRQETSVANGQFIQIAINGNQGTYFVRISKDNKTLKTVKVIKE